MATISEKAAKYKSVEEVKAELRSVQSAKCRLAKQKARKDYDVEMDRIVLREHALKEIKQFMEPNKITTTTMSDEDIKTLTYDETIKAIKSIQSKKCLSKHITEDESENVEYQLALSIEQKLLAHKLTVKPTGEADLKKSDVNELISYAETMNLSKEELLEKFKELLK